MEGVHLTVHGFVQGVFLRANIRKKALELGLKGYVKNMPDSTVEIVAEGPEDKLNEIVEFCRSNPGASKVSKVEVKFSQPKNEFNEFEVRY